MSFLGNGSPSNFLNEIAALLDPMITFSYSEQEKRSVWNKAGIIPGRDPNVFRRGPYGELLQYDHHGKSHLATGWDYGHAIAKAFGGSDRLSNLRPERCSTNRSHGNIIAALLRNTPSSPRT